MRAAFLFLSLFFLLLVSPVISNAQDNGNSFVWVISNMEVLQQRENMVLGDEFVIFHDYDRLEIKYFNPKNESEVFFYRSQQLGKSLTLSLRSGGKLEIKHDGEVIFSAVTHKDNFMNVLRYKSGIVFQDELPIIFIGVACALAITFSRYYRREWRLL